MTRLAYVIKVLSDCREAAIDLDEQIAHEHPAADPDRHIGIALPVAALAHLIEELETAGLEEAARARISRRLLACSAALSAFALAASLVSVWIPCGR